ncbi:hypothetical protein ACFQT4_11650 [Pseudoduganella danionis]
MMKHLKLMPLLIAAAFMMPRAHAAEEHTGRNAGTSYAALWIGIGMLLLGGSQQRNEPFKPLDE